MNEKTNVGFGVLALFFIFVLFVLTQMQFKGWENRTKALEALEHVATHEHKHDSVKNLEIDLMATDNLFRIHEESIHYGR